MYPRLRTLLSLFICLWWMGACSEEKKEDPVPEPEPVVACKLLKEEVVHPNQAQSHNREYIFMESQLYALNDVYPANPALTSTMNFEAGTHDRINSTTVIRNGSVFQYYLFSHNAEGLITKVELYSKTGGPSSQPVLTSYREHTYNASKQLVGSKNYQVTSAAPRLLHDYTFTYNAKGNLTQVREYRTFNHQSDGTFNDIVVRTSYTHDDKVNPYHEYRYQNYLPPGLLIPNLSPNNILTLTSMTTTEGTTFGPGPNFDPAPLNFTGTNTYTYTTNNRPASVTGSQGTVRTFTYQCK